MRFVLFSFLWQTFTSLNMRGISEFIFSNSGCPNIGNQLGDIIMKHLFILSLITLALCISCSPKAEVHSVTQDAPQAEEQIKPEVKEDVKADEAKAEEAKPEAEAKAEENKQEVKEVKPEAEAKADEAKAEEAKPEAEVKAEEAKPEEKSNKI